jgi:hypothetical protein
VTSDTPAPPFGIDPSVATAARMYDGRAVSYLAAHARIKSAPVLPLDPRGGSLWKDDSP